VVQPPHASNPLPGLLEDDLKEWVIQQAAQLHQEYFASTGSAASAAATASAGSVLDRVTTLAKELAAPRNTAADDYALLVELAGVVSETSGSGISAFELSSSGLIPRYAGLHGARALPYQRLTRHRGALGSARRGGLACCGS